MSLDADQLFGLLPAVYRTRDAQSGGQLQALFAVIAGQAAVVEESIRQLYDDQFIETCSTWAIPYIGDLIGYNSIYELSSAGGESRAEVANTIGYRRRKGTLLALEQMSMDVSGRPAAAVEEFKRLITTESMRHVKPGHLGTVDIRRRRALRRMGTAFDVENYTIDVRRVAPRARVVESPDAASLDIALHGPGRFNIPEVAIHLWRWQQSWQVADQPAFSLGGGRYMFSPLGNDMPLFSAPEARTAFSSLTTYADVPHPVGRDAPAADVYGTAGGFQLTADGVAVDAGQIYFANLADRPGGAWCRVGPGKIAIDPHLGRISFAADVPLPQALLVSYAYGFPAPVAGGPYDRTASLSSLEPAAAELVAVVGTPPYETLADAVLAWNDLPAGSTGVIVLAGFDSQAINLTEGLAVQLPAGSSLTIAAGVVAGGAGASNEIIWNSSRVTLTGDIEVTGVAAPPPAAGSNGAADDGGALPPAALPPAGQLLMSGMWIAGQLLVTGDASTIGLSDCTLVPGLGLLPCGEPMFPGEPSVVVTAKGVTLVCNRVISGPIAADASGTTHICASILDGTSSSHVAYAGPDLASAGPDLHVEDSTIVGKVRTRTMSLASNTIFHARLGRRDPWTAAVWASRKQTGCVRFCVLPYDSITPSRYNCLPPDVASQPALAPSFVTLRYGDPAYALLSGDCPMAVWTGADNGSQIGAYLQIKETEAVANVALRASEYLPALLESGIFIHPSEPQPKQAPPPPLYGYGFGVRAPEPLQEGQSRLPGIGAELI